jgi:hypothetical protein
MMANSLVRLLYALAVFPNPVFKPERSAPLVEIARPALPSLLLATLRRFDSLHPSSTPAFLFDVIYIERCKMRSIKPT